MQRGGIFHGLIRNVANVTGSVSPVLMGCLFLTKRGVVYFLNGNNDVKISGGYAITMEKEAMCN
ncbi:hypothetical protein DCM91_10180 [Chitinophaga costaii]|nr:hypothetical protein DCM91_10180 [Chitinophaga costaii]